MLSAEIAVARGLSLKSDLSLGFEDQKNIEHLELGIEAACSGGRCMDNKYTVQEHCWEVATQLAERAQSIPYSAHRNAALACVESVQSELLTVDQPTDERRLPSIDDLLDFAIRQTEATYALLPTAPTDTVGIRFDVAGGEEAVTTFAIDDAASRTADVLVGIPDRYLGKLYFGELTRIQHEVFVHAVQGLEGSGRRRAYGPTCPVAEGLVDTAAHRSLMRAMNAGGLLGNLARFGNIFRREATSKHGARFGNRTGMMDRERTILMARQGGQSLFDAIEAARGGEDAESYAIQAAMAINVLDLDATARRDTLQTLRMALQGGSQSERRRVLGILDDIIHRPDRATADFFANAL